MKNIKQFTQLLSVLIFLTSCRTSIIKEDSLINSDGNINENANLKKKKVIPKNLEIKILKQKN